MCGRTCLTLVPEKLKCACKYQKVEVDEEDMEEIVPSFRNEYNLGLVMSKLS